jgi:hypothetical protein
VTLRKRTTTGTACRDCSGIESQVARHCALYPDDPDVTAYRALPSSAFDSPAAGAAHGIRWLSLAEIHHSLTDRRPVVALVLIGRTVFFRVELSAVERPGGSSTATSTGAQWRPPGTQRPRNEKTKQGLPWTTGGRSGRSTRSRCRCRTPGG